MAVIAWKLANADEALKLISNDPLGSPSIDHKPVGIDLESNLSFSGDAGGRLALNVRGGLSVAVLNQPTDTDEDGILGTQETTTPEGDLPPQVALTDRRAWLKYRAEAGVKASADVAIGELMGIDASAETSAIFADYRVHDRGQQARGAFALDLAEGARFVTRREDVESLDPDEALAFRFAGTLQAAVTVSWSDVFTGQIGTLGKLLGTTMPIAFSVKAGASVTADVRVSDDFLIVFSRVNDERWRVGVRKVKSSRVAPSLDAGIDVGFANPGQFEGLVASALDGVLGAPLARVKAILDAASLESLGSLERRLASALIDRVGLEEEFATIQMLRQRVEDIEQRIRGVIRDVARTRIALSFAYEYSRVSERVSLLQATLDRASLERFHADLIRARTQPIAAAIAGGDPRIVLETYLNQKTITRTHSWGFTLGFGKWAKVGGRDFKKVSTVRRLDLHDRVQESYLGTRSYRGQWVGESFEWGVDLKAEMKDYSSEPLVSDFSFGVHLLWLAEQKDLSASELEQWLDTAVIWRVMREQDLPDVRGRLVRALDGRATVTVQVTVPNTVFRSILPSLASASAESFAPALGAAMPWMKESLARTSAGRRRHVYGALWASYLKNPDQSQESLARRAFERLQAEGHQELAPREKMSVGGPDAFTFAGLARLNGNTRAACDAFTRGARILETSIENGARNQKTIDKAVREMDDLWAQSHHVRAIGVYLLDAAARAGVLDEVTRTMTLEASELPESVVVTV